MKKITLIALTIVILLCVVGQTSAYTVRLPVMPGWLLPGPSPMCQLLAGIYVSAEEESREEAELGMVALTQSLIRDLEDEESMYPAAIESGSVPRTTQKEYGDIELLLSEDPDVSNLIAIREEFIERLLSADPSTLAQIVEAYLSGDYDTIAMLLGYTDADIEELDYQIRAARENLLSRYPELTLAIKNLPDLPCTESRCPQFVNQFMSRLEQIRKEPGILRDVKCRIIPYVACLVVCTGTGPFGYFFCSLVCVCSFCEGGWVDRLCDLF
ncbi:MAG: hypothetical protein ACUVQ7_07670 [bacterium]